MNKVILRKGKEIPVMRRHHWIFSGAIEKGLNFPDGEIAETYSYDGKFLGFGYFSKIPRTLTGRMISFYNPKDQEENKDPFLQLRRNIKKAKELREKLFNLEKTNCFRVINGEGDDIPGLVVDKYNEVLVIQVSTLGIEKNKEEIIKILVNEFNPKSIYEKSNLPSRREEGLDMFEGFVYGEEVSVVEVIENGNKFLIDLKNSHKTGFYLDQREMRAMIGELANNKTLLNCFSYTGGFSVYAAKNGSIKVTSVDISKEVIDQAKKNFEANNLEVSKHEFIAEDVFKFLNEKEILDYDIVILDPPAFAKKKSDVPNALSGYKRINKETLRKIKKGSFLLTCSCSYHVDDEMFRRMLFECAIEVKRQIKVIASHRLAMDHALNIFHQEMDYLKSYLLFIE